MTDQNRKAIILGATGAVGKAVLAELMSAPQYAEVHSFVRRAYKDNSSFKDNSKLVEHIVDFDKLLDESQQPGSSSAAAGTEADKLRQVGNGAEAVYIALGTTRAGAGGAKPFERIDREYVLAAARAASRGAASSQSPQRVVYCSAQAANSGSPFLYMKSKGLTEEGLATAGYSDCILFRPGFLAEAKREKTRYLETFYGALMTHVVSRFSSEVEIKVPTLAKAMVAAGLHGTEGIKAKGFGSPPTSTFARGDSATTVSVVPNGEAKRLAAAF